MILIIFGETFKLSSSSLCSLLQPLPPFLVQIFSSAPISPNTLNLYCSLTVTDQVLHPYETTGKTTVLYVLILKFLERRQEDKKDSEQNGSNNLTT
jgi:hypothetical protein